jgi:hypothetical protein
MTPDLCPFCSRPLHVGIQPAGKRYCSLCGGKIKKRHKYRIGSDGRLIHKSCDNPTGQVETNQEKRMFEE